MQWTYQTLQTRDVNQLDGYRAQGYQVLHAHYHPSEGYRFLMGKREFEWFLSPSRSGFLSTPKYASAG